MSDKLLAEIDRLRMLVAGILEFGKSHDGCVERDIDSSLSRLREAVQGGAGPSPDDAAFKVGDQVKKDGGDYTFTGEVRAAFTKRGGVRRYVVENEAGLCHIFNEGQLDDAKVRARGADMSDGRRLIPREPTPEIEQAMHAVWYAGAAANYIDYYRAIYRAASPIPPAGPQEFFPGIGSRTIVVENCWRDDVQAHIRREHSLSNSVTAALDRERVDARRAALLEAVDAVKRLERGILHVYERPGGPPGNRWRPATLDDAIAALRALAVEGKR